MIVIARWTGVQTLALREALRKSVDKFADLLHVDRGTIIGWERKLAAANIRPENQQSLDNLVGTAAPDVLVRFEQLLAQAAISTPIAPTPAAGSIIDLHSVLDDPEMRAWIEMNRRQVLRLLTAAGSLPAAAMLAGLDGDEVERLVFATWHTVDAKAVGNVETIVASTLQQYETFGPATAFPVVRAQSQHVDTLLGNCPEDSMLKPRLLSVRAALSRGLAWMAGDLGHPDAECDENYETARKAAHQAGDTDQAALVLCSMSWLETDRGNAGGGVDHAVAALNWAKRGHDHYLAAYAADMAAEAYAKRGDETDCRTALDYSRALAESGDGAESLAYFYSRGLNASLRSGCLITLGKPKLAVAAASEAVDLVDPRFSSIKGFAMINLANAHSASGEIDETAAALVQCAELAAAAGSPPLVKELRNTRAHLGDLAPGSASLRELDEKLEAYTLA